jgi:hypothetical protein
MFITVQFYLKKKRTSSEHNISCYLHHHVSVKNKKNLPIYQLECIWILQFQSTRTKLNGENYIL